ncbi:MAG: baseplate J/gp47 family protein [Candidatus Levybacteria bacterium]|nr:baseplate J/gp47 family protein [Candidatus Levybacteria bacterium]
MKLPAIPFLTKTVSTDFFLSLIFESEKISSILFKEQEKVLVILASYEAAIDLDNASVEDFVTTCDTVISRLEMSLPEGAILEKTIFSVPHSWVEEGKIKANRLSQLKKVSEELALTPMGFIVSIEAIIASLQRKEGVPVSGIFVDLSEKYLSVFIVRSGNIIDIKQGPIEDGVEKTVERLLGNVTQLDVLPSKIILLHNKEAEEVSQKFLSHHWTKELPFMHLPQVAILDRGFENEAIINGVASQLNVTVSGDINIATSEVIGENEEFVSESKDTFGFLMDEDIASVQPTQPPSPAATPADEGFDFAEEVGHEPIVRHHGQDEPSDAAGEEVFEEDTPDPNRKEGKSLAAGIGTFFAGLITPQSVGRIPKMVGNGRRLIIPFAALFVVALLLTAYYTVLLKAKVTIFTDQKAFAENAMAITLTTSGESSFEDKTLRISTVVQEVEGEESQETTGQKDTGEKAIGAITIFNKSESPRQIDKGTTITSSNNLKFTLNDAVNIASTSSFATSFSNAQVKVTASNFGKEYNLPSQTNFTIEGMPTSTVFGRNDAAFSGGSKEEIQVVAKKDLLALEETVTERLFDKAKSDAESRISQNEALMPTFLSVDFKEKKYDKKENEEAENITLNASIEYTLGVYKKDELSNFISSSSEFDVPEDFKLSGDDSSITITDIKQNRNNISAKLSFNAIFKPQLDVKNVPSEIAGKGRDAAIGKLKEISGITDATIQFTGSIPFLPLILPLNQKNISIEQEARQ